MSKFKEGDLILCTKGTVASNTLVNGNVYTVLEYNEESDEVKVKTTNGETQWWCAYRFEPIQYMTKEQELYLRLQSTFVEHTNLKVGDLVKITAKAESLQHGWQCMWHEGLDKYVGTSAYVMDITKYGIQCSATNNTSSSFNFPYFVLEKKDFKLPQSITLPSGDYEVKFHVGGDIQVGCQSIPYKTLKKIYEAATTVVELSK